MKIKPFVCSFFMLLNCLDLPAESPAEFRPTTIRMLVKKKSPAAFVEVKGPYQVIDPSYKGQLSFGSYKRSIIEPVNDGLKWGERFPGNYQIAIVPTSQETTFLLDGIEYQGALEVYHINGSISCINELPLEFYLKSHMSNLYGASNLSKKELEVLAINERTNLYYEIRQNKNPFWHFDAEQMGYGGYASRMIDAKIDQAVDTTSSIILVYKDQPFPTATTQDCAGSTCAISTLLRKNIPTPSGVSLEPAKNHRLKSTWSFAISKEELESRLDTKNIEKIDLYLDKDSKKCYGVRLTSSVGTKQFSFSAFQDLVGKDLLLSNDFEVTLAKGQATFHGFGKGNGSGICLYSLEQLAKGKLTPAQILSTFYPLSFLQKISSN